MLILFLHSLCSAVSGGIAEPSVGVIMVKLDERLRLYWDPIPSDVKTFAEKHVDQREMQR